MKYWYYSMNCLNSSNQFSMSNYWREILFEIRSETFPWQQGAHFRRFTKSSKLTLPSCNGASWDSQGGKSKKPMEQPFSLLNFECRSAVETGIWHSIFWKPTMPLSSWNQVGVQSVSIILHYLETCQKWCLNLAVPWINRSSNEYRDRPIWTACDEWLIMVMTR